MKIRDKKSLYYWLILTVILGILASVLLSIQHIQNVYEAPRELEISEIGGKKYSAALPLVQLDEFQTGYYRKFPVQSSGRDDYVLYWNRNAESAYFSLTKSELGGWMSMTGLYVIDSTAATKHLLEFMRKNFSE